MELTTEKAINNNVVSCRDPQGREHIVMGRGLGFGLKRGQLVPQEKIEKVFSMTKEGELQRLKELFTSFPPSHVEFCTELIQYAGETLERQLSESVYFTLCDHICFAIYRVEHRMSFQNALHTEVRLFYPREYSVGCYAVQEMQRRFGVTMPEDEAASIALHLVNAQYETSLGITMEVTQALGKMRTILETDPDFGVDVSVLAYDELVLHLKFLALSLFSGCQEEDREDCVVELVEQAIPEKVALAKRLTRHLERASQRTLTRQQLAYLALYLHRNQFGTK